MTEPSPVDLACAGLALAAVDANEADGARLALRRARELWGRGVDDVPLTLVHDVSLIVLYSTAARLVGTRDVGGLGGVLAEEDRAHVRDARLLYEDRVLAPLLGDPSVIAAHIVVAALSNETREAAVAHVLTALLPRLSAELGLRQNIPGALRRLEDDGMSGAELDGDAVLACADVLMRLSSRSPPRPALLPEELWELARLDALPSEAVRLALRAVHRFVVRLPMPAPWVVARLKDRRAQVQLDDVEPDAFPAGGFDAMSTRGTLENLVRSEVAYVGVGAEDDARAPDLFDVRFVEGELLYYTRDESPLLERRRTLIVHIEQVERMRHKLRELPTQTLVLIYACVLRAHADLQMFLGAQAVVTTIALSGDAAVVTEERGLLGASLDDDLAHRRAALVDVDELPAVRRVTFSPLPAPKQTRGAVWVRVGGPTWRVTDAEKIVDVDVGAADGARALVDRLMLSA